MPFEGGAGRRWYAAQCLANREAGAMAQLRNQEFQVFFPRRQKSIRHARKVETRLVPFFPGYLFVHLDLSLDRWRSVNGTYGVARLVANGDLPAPVPHGVIENLKTACTDDDIITWAPSLVAGEDIRILSGPFTDLIGEFVRLDSASCVRVLLDIMGARIATVLPRSSVISATSVV